MCICIELADKALAVHNTQLDPIFRPLPGRLSQVVGIRTVKIDRKKRGLPKTLMASFCPFCGIKLDD